MIFRFLTSVPCHGFRGTVESDGVGRWGGSLVWEVLSEFSTTLATEKGPAMNGISLEYILG